MGDGSKFIFQDKTDLGTPYTWQTDFLPSTGYIRRNYLVNGYTIQVTVQPDMETAPFAVIRDNVTIYAGTFNELISPYLPFPFGSYLDKLNYLIDTYYLTKRGGTEQFALNVLDNTANENTETSQFNMLFGGTIINENATDAYVKFHHGVYIRYTAIGNRLGGDFICKVPANGEKFLPISYPFQYAQYAFMSVANDAAFTSFLAYPLDLQFALIMTWNV
jgi:hypothetical protein